MTRTNATRSRIRLIILNRIRVKTRRFRRIRMQRGKKILKTRRRVHKQRNRACRINPRAIVAFALNTHVRSVVQSRQNLPKKTTTKKKKNNRREPGGTYFRFDFISGILSICVSIRIYTCIWSIFVMCTAAPHAQQ